MKKTIGGVTYDTDIATEIASGSHRHELSQAWWRLYRTPSGAYFEVAADHDGVVNEFQPVADERARKFLEVNANHLVEEHFGPMREPKRARFARRTVNAAINVLDKDNKFTHAEISSFLIDLDREIYDAIREKGISIKARLNDLKKFVDDHPGYVVDGELFADIIVEKAVASLPPDEIPRPWSTPDAPSPVIESFKRALESDGFVVTDRVLRRSSPVDLGLPETESELIRLLSKHGFTTAKGHLEQAFESHARGLWASANSQIRSFLESLFDEMATRIDPAATTRKPGRERRAHLANVTSPIFDRSLNEWGDNGVGFINGLMARLHPHGSHPGLSDQQDSSFRLHVVLLTAHLALKRFDARR
ncbi:hypothetical protein [Phreatobacter stygius]|uniref:Uncharacterized protein n=1 Tax=Phreatobacter stygius TaxID=1940610 RepID=A0A4D7BEH0_9HYPH|nr:hypothetical protein [Phreatobacter stygius]QCI66327.1 hypothetical protein E8M01_20150 [Phreatobacter stygius]